MGGEGAIRELTRLDSNVKAIMASGYFSDPIVANYRGYGFRWVIRKPFGVEELSQVVKMVIEGIV